MADAAEGEKRFRSGIRSHRQRYIKKSVPTPFLHSVLIPNSCELLAKLPIPSTNTNLYYYAHEGTGALLRIARTPPAWMFHGMQSPVGASSKSYRRIGLETLAGRLLSRFYPDR